MSRQRPPGETESGDEASSSPHRPSVGLVLGGGAARGWAHIGILRVLEEAGLRPDVVAGTSIGAVVGGCWAAGKLDALEEFARSLNRRRVFTMMDFSLAGSGLITGDRLRRRLEEGLEDIRIERMDVRYAAVATEISTGHEIWLTEGDLARAMRASYAIPGIFNPVRIGRRWLVDGVLVNPIPVSAARALGAEFVVAVNLHSDVFGRSTVVHNFGDESEPDPERADGGGLALLAPLLRGNRRDGDAPRIASVMVDAFNITQDRIARSRLAGDPPDVMVGPKLGHVGLMDFHRADEAIAVGMEAARRLLPEIRDCFEPVGVRR